MVEQLAPPGRHRTLKELLATAKRGPRPSRGGKDQGPPIAPAAGGGLLDGLIEARRGGLLPSARGTSPSRSGKDGFAVRQPKTGRSFLGEGFAAQYPGLVKEGIGLTRPLPVGEVASAGLDQTQDFLIGLLLTSAAPSALGAPRAARMRERAAELRGQGVATGLAATQAFQEIGQPKAFTLPW